MNTVIANLIIDKALSGLAIIACLTGVSFWVAWSRYNNNRWRYAVAPTIWLLHAVVYFVVREIAPAWLTLDVRATWKLTIILHGVISLIFGGAVMWQLTKKRAELERKAHEILKTLHE